MRIYRTALVLVAAMLVAAAASAQGWKGMGRMAGKVTDESGKPLEGVTVKLVLPSANGGTEVKTDKKGEWTVGGIAGGNWQVDFTRDGYEPRHITVTIQELSRIPPVEIQLKKAAPNPNEVIAGQMKQAQDLVSQKKFDEAQAIYQDLLTKYPQAYQIYVPMARAYDMQGAYDKEIDALKKYLEKDPNNATVKLLTGAVMVSHGHADEGKQLLASVNDADIKSPDALMQVGFDMLNQKNPKDALMFFDRAVTRFPDFADGYYWRGSTELQLGTQLAPDNKAEGEKMIDAAKTDLNKYVQMAPTDPKAETAKKILEQLK